MNSVFEDETQQGIDVVKKRLINQVGYNKVKAADVLNNVASTFARGDTNE